MKNDEVADRAEAGRNPTEQNLRLPTLREQFRIGVVPILRQMVAIAKPSNDASKAK
jgi:hypothetical protein